MNIRPACSTAMGIAILLAACFPAFPQAAPASPAPVVAPHKHSPAEPGGQELLLPARICNVPPVNDFNNADSEFCFKRSKASGHFGLAGAQGFSQVQLDKAGWRYGFLAHKDDGSRVYSSTFSKSDGSAEFIVPANTKFLWLVVMGAPTEHWIRVGDRRRPAAATAAPNANEQWPYKFRVTGTAPDDSMVH